MGKSGINDYNQTTGMKRFRCSDCDFDLCEKCFNSDLDPRTAKEEITDETRKELITAFRAFDADGDGFIDECEMKAKMKEVGEELTEEEYEEMIDAADINKDGKIS